MPRAADAAIAALLLVAALPVLALVALAVYLTSRGPVLHRSDRVGRGGAIFRMPKFRSMRAGTPDLATDLLPDPRSRLTPVGGLIRRTSVDELPQLWSVLVGDMALVGPRPALHNQRSLVAARAERGIDRLRPGITGWAQVNGRDEITEAEKVRLDAEYLSRRSPAFDVRILLMTALRAVGGSGVAH